MLVRNHHTYLNSEELTKYCFICAVSSCIVNFNIRLAHCHFMLSVNFDCTWESNVVHPLHWNITHLPSFVTSDLLGKHWPLVCVHTQLLKVEETCRKSEEMTKELEERIKSNLEQKSENRNAQIEAMVQKLKEHVSVFASQRFEFSCFNNKLFGESFQS